MLFGLDLTTRKGTFGRWSPWGEVNNFQCHGLELLQQVGFCEGAVRSGMDIDMWGLGCFCIWLPQVIFISFVQMLVEVKMKYQTVGSVSLI